MMTFREELLHKKRQRILEENPEEAKHMKEWFTEVFLDNDLDNYRSKYTYTQLKVIEALGFNYDVLDAVLDYEDVEPGKPYVRVNRGF